MMKPEFFCAEDERDWLRQQLAASQAREQQLRDALRNSYVELFHCNQQLTSVLDEDDEPLYTTGKTVSDSLAESKSLLDCPSDTSALEALIRKAGEVMRERCSGRASEINPIYGTAYVIQEIRALPSVTLDDLKGGES